VKQILIDFKGDHLGVKVEAGEVRKEAKRSCEVISVGMFQSEVLK
jgi:hypothetical protein